MNGPGTTGNTVGFTDPATRMKAQGLLRYALRPKPEHALEVLRHATQLAAPNRLVVFASRGRIVSVAAQVCSNGEWIFADARRVVVFPSGNHDFSDVGHGVTQTDPVSFFASPDSSQPAHGAVALALKEIRSAIA